VATNNISLYDDLAISDEVYLEQLVGDLCISNKKEFLELKAEEAASKLLAEELKPKKLQTNQPHNHHMFACQLHSRRLLAQYPELWSIEFPLPMITW
jgi:hypothetical protein